MGSIAARSLLGVSIFLLALAAPLMANSPAESAAPEPAPPSRSTSIFYYPWYGTPERDQHWRHWEQGAVIPPEDVGANFYPLRGTYSSSDPAVLDAHMHEIAASGVDTVVISWWGRGSFEDSVVGPVIDAVRKNSLRFAIHVEPYQGRSAATLRDDLAHLHALGAREVYLYNALNLPSAGVRDVVKRFGDITVWVQSGGPDARSGALSRWAAAAGAYGIYTYDPYGVRPSDFAGICASAHRSGLKCAPSVGPGWDGTKATKFSFIGDRRGGARYEEYWSAALAAGADVVSITSYNEWHEGTTIEPARSRACLANQFCFQDYAGGYGWHGEAAGWAYLDRTRHWTKTTKQKEPTLNERLDVLSGAIRTGNTTAIDTVAAHPALAGYKR